MPIQRTSSVPVKVQNAITQASRRTGASFEYLLNTAKRESAFRTNAKSPSSSATGLFQFIEGTWLKVVKEDGDRLGLSHIAKNIRKTSSGQYYVPNRGKRREILALRNDAETSALVAAAYTEHNEKYVRGRIGRMPTDGELYLAHFLGPGSAAKMIRLAEQRPDSPANRYFPAAARANKSIFYKNGRPRSLAEVHKILISSHVDGQNPGMRRSDEGGFAFGIMGSLMADMNSSQMSYGKGREGSIGVWGDMTGGVSRTGEAGRSDTRKDATARTARNRSAGALAAAPAGHRQAAAQYRSTAKAVEGGQPSAGDWIRDAFEGG